jgi:hypothetical protein
MSIEGVQNIADAAAGSAYQQIQISKEAVKHSSQTNYIQLNATESSIFGSSTRLSWLGVVSLG